MEQSYSRHRTLGAVESNKWNGFRWMHHYQYKTLVFQTFEIFENPYQQYWWRMLETIFFVNKWEMLVSVKNWRRAPTMLVQHPKIGIGRIGFSLQHQYVTNVTFLTSMFKNYSWVFKITHSDETFETSIYDCSIAHAFLSCGWPTVNHRTVWSRNLYSLSRVLKSIKVAS